MKRKPPKNYLPMYETGYGLWKIWVDDGPHTAAYEVFPNRIYLRDDEARGAAIGLAAKNPTRRYCVKGHHG